MTDHRHHATSSTGGANVAVVITTRARHVNFLRLPARHTDDVLIWVAAVAAAAKRALCTRLVVGLAD